MKRFPSVLLAMAFLLSSSATALASHEVTRWRNNHQFAASLTFDDGLRSHVTTATDLLAERGLVGTFFIISDTAQYWPSFWEDFRSVAQLGNEIGSHTISHPDLTTLTEAQIRQELQVARDAIDASIPGQSCLTLAYPYGAFNDLVENLSAEYYVSARSVWSRQYQNYYPQDTPSGKELIDFYNVGGIGWDPQTGRTFAERKAYTDLAQQTRGWLVPYMHSLETTEAVNFISALMDDLIARDVWIGTYGDVARYMQERISSTLSVVGQSPTEITLNLSHYLDDTVFDVPLTIRSTIPASWSQISVVQGSAVQNVSPSIENRETVIYYDAIPNGGPITLKPGFVTNTAPVVEAGTAQTLRLPKTLALLDGTVVDDGLPVSSVPAATWTCTSAPGGVTFVNATLVDTSVYLSVAGTYVFRLTVSDGELSAFDEVTVVLEPALTAPVVVESRIATGSDDVEEAAAGTVYLNSSDLELVYDSWASAGNQTVGMRFTGLALPQGAYIQKAWIQFKVMSSTSKATSLTVRGQAADSAAAFTTTAKNVSSRATTTAKAAWVPAVWTTVGQSGEAQRTPDLSAVVQEIVSRPGWAQGNAMVLLVTGTGTRNAVAYETAALGAPLLHVEYWEVAPANKAPVVNAGADATIRLPTTAVYLDATVSDDGLPTPSRLVYAWSQVSGPGTAVFGSAATVDTSVTLPLAGTWVLRLTASDGALSASDDVTITVENATVEYVTAEYRVTGSTNDAEEAVSGTVYTNSSDLELVYDSYASAGNQTVGVRFTGLTIPAGAVVKKAWLQFKVDETGSKAVALAVRAQAADNAAVFAATSKNLSARALTSAQVAWAPAAWTTVGQVAEAQRTPDLAALVQEVVNRPGWAAGNSIAFIITGTGTRTAVACDAEAQGAPVLHLEYQTGGTLRSLVWRAGR